MADGAMKEAADKSRTHYDWGLYNKKSKAVLAAESAKKEERKRRGEEEEEEGKRKDVKKHDEIVEEMEDRSMG